MVSSFFGICCVVLVAMAASLSAWHEHLQSVPDATYNEVIAHRFTGKWVSYPTGITVQSLFSCGDKHTNVSPLVNCLSMILHRHPNITLRFVSIRKFTLSYPICSAYIALLFWYLCPACTWKLQAHWWPFFRVRTNAGWWLGSAAIFQRSADCCDCH